MIVALHHGKEQRRTLTTRGPVLRVAIEAEVAGDEFVLFDPTAGHFHTLNPTAAAVWHACDGTATLAEIAARTELPIPYVEMALAQFAELSIIEAAGTTPGMTRKEAMCRIAAAGLLGVAALPVIGSITGIDRAAAATCIPAGVCCPANASGGCIPECCGSVLSFDLTCSSIWRCT